MSSIWLESLASCPGLARLEAPVNQRMPVLRFQSRPSTRAGDGQPSGRTAALTSLKRPLSWAASLRHSCGVDARGRADPDRTVRPTSVPWAGSDVRPLVTHARTLERPAAVASLVRRHSQQPGLVVPLSLRGAILAPTVIRFERHPAPGDLARVGHICLFRVCLDRILGVPRKSPG
jgi:hypothetical protein